MTTEAYLVISIIFAAAMFQTIFGFGSALIAMPLLSLTIGLPTSAPLVCLLSAMISIYMLLFSWRDVHLTSIKGLIIGAFFGIPTGTFLIKKLGSDPLFESILNMVLGFIIISFSLFQLFKPHVAKLKTNLYSIPAGIIAGILGGAYNTNGPPVVIYGTLKKWNPNEFRASLQAFFAFSNIHIIASHTYYGNFTNAVIKYSLYSLIPAILAMALGMYLSKKIPVEKFNKSIYILLIIMGIIFCYKSIR